MLESITLSPHIWHSFTALTTPYGLLSCFVVYIAYKFVWNKWFSPLGKIPGPWHMALTSIVPMIKHLQGEKLQYMQKLHRKYGPLVRSGPNAVSVADPLAVRTIQSSHRFRKGDFYEVFKTANQENIASFRDPDLFKKRKNLVAPMFSVTSIAKHEDLIHKVGVSKLKARFQEFAKTGETVDAMKYFMATTFDVIGELALGGSFNVLDTGEHPAIKWLSDAAIIRFCRYILGHTLAEFLLPGRSQGDRNLANYALSVLEKRRKEENPRQDLLQRLIEATDEDGNHLLDDMIAAEMIVQMVGGTDTIASTLTWAINAMLDHPVWFDRIYQELKTELDDIPENVPASRLARLPVLNAVIDETMRLFPALPQDFQRVVPPEGVEFCGKFLPGGTILNPQMYTVHTDPNLWEDPDSFKPERWLKENPTDQLNESFPFSRGVHACIGRNLAMSELRMLLSMLVYYFKFERVGNDDMSFNTISITTPRCHRLNVRLSERVH